jgi:hypothetical protein
MLKLVDETEAPWTRRPGESASAYAAFATYRDMGTSRSTAKVARQLGKSKTLCDRWSAAHAWVARAEACDAHLDHLHREAHRRAVEEMAERHARIAMAAQTKIMQRLQALAPEELSPRTLIEWLRVVTEVERRARGVPEKHEVTGPAGGPVEVVQLSDDQRRERLIALRAELDRRLEAQPA